MSDRIRPMSRRALVRSAAAAPLIAIGAQLRAGLISEAEAADAVCQHAEIPEADKQELVRKAKAVYGQNLPEDKYKGVVGEVWAYVMIGTGCRPIAGNPATNENAVVAAFDYPSPGTIANQESTGRCICRDLDRVPPPGSDAPTIACAYLVGLKAAAAARDAGRPDDITWADYTTGWRQVHAFIGKRTDRALKAGLDSGDRSQGMFGSGC